MQYDWKKIFDDQKESTLSIKEYCKQNDICVSSFYKSRKRLNHDEHEENLFVPVEVVHERSFCKIHC